MAESCENLDNILRGCAKDKVQKGLAEALNRFERREETFRKRFRKNTRAVSVGSQTRQNQVKNWCW